MNYLNPRVQDVGNKTAALQEQRNKTVLSWFLNPKVLDLKATHEAVPCRMLLI